VGRLPSDFERIDVKLSPLPWHVWALSDHYNFDFAGSPKRSYLGELVYKSKYHHDRDALRELLTAVQHCVLQLRRFSDKVDGLASATVVAAVPCNPPKQLSVPHEVASVTAATLAVHDGSTSIVKLRPTPSAKTAPSLHPDAYEVRRSFEGQSVVLVDDLFHTGATMESVAHHVRNAGADHLVGLCITRARNGMIQ